MRERAPSAARTPDVAGMVEDVIGCKWSLKLLQLIADGVERPSAFQRACPGLSAKVMNERLAKLQRFGIASRTVAGTKPPLRVSYALTPFGRRFVGVLDEVRRLQLFVDANPEPDDAHDGHAQRTDTSAVKPRPRDRQAGSPAP